MNQYEHVLSAIKSASNIVITAHKSPDGDSIGSSLGLSHFLKKLGKQAVVCQPDPTPSFLQWLDTGEILVMSEQPEDVRKSFDEADLVFCLDYNTTDRVGEEMQALLENYSGKIIMIDHHLDPDDFATLMLSDTGASSTSEMIVELIEQTGNLDLLDAENSVPLYLGIMTDTGSFRYPSTTSRTHEVVGKLLATGMPHHEIHEALSEDTTVNRLRLRSFAIDQKMEIIPEYGVSIISLTKEEMDRYDYQKGDTDNLVNVPLSITGVNVSILAKEGDDIVKLSFRSKGDEVVNIFAAENFDGGGHERAAGGISEESMEATMEKIKMNLPRYFRRTD
jgi:phosphoesterase RecJ-like protein